MNPEEATSKRRSLCLFSKINCAINTQPYMKGGEANAYVD